MYYVRCTMYDVRCSECLVMMGRGGLDYDTGYYENEKIVMTDINF